MDMRGSRYVSCASYVDFSTVRMTSPTCEELGIPTEVGEEAGAVYSPFFTPRVIHNPSLHLDGLRYEAEAHKISDPYSKISDPYSPLCMIPLPGNLALHASAEPSFIRKRNERERERVRCVNEGYERLKEHLPNASKDKRISKVETLRGAIDYIRQLQKILDEAPPLLPTAAHTTSSEPGEDSESGDPTTRRRSVMKSSAAAAKAALETRMAPSDGERACRTRRGSLSSEQSAQSDGTLSESEDEPFLKKRPRLQ